ncbi:MAG: hypothetical protein Q9191_001266 [Dirinaria sp. TL-2023a]
MPSTRGLARHTLGISLLLVTVLLWTASSFLASTILADDTYSKPYLITYVNSFFFALLLPVDLLRRLGGNTWPTWRRTKRPSAVGYSPLAEAVEDGQALFKPGDEAESTAAAAASHRGSGRQSAPDGLSSSSERLRKSSAIVSEQKLNLRQTAKLGFEFSVLWFAANYFVAACLEFTTVASSTILTSTSSTHLLRAFLHDDADTRAGIWTLIFGAFYGVERFTFRKLLGVLMSFAGILLTSSVDISGKHDEHRGSFPHKSPQQIALGDALALTSAVLYGIYATTIKRKIGDEARVNMLLFFGFVGLFGVIILLPGFPLLHLIGMEKFQLPPSRRIVTIILINAAISLLSDIAWAYAMLLTSPLLVTVGLSLTIPLSLVGEMIINSQTSSVAYCIGAVIVLMSFLFINYESKAGADHSRTKQGLNSSAIGHHQEGAAN